MSDFAKDKDALISRQSAIEAECAACSLNPPRERGHNCRYYVKGCPQVECLRNLPSAQPEIIRCKDCKHWGIHKWLNIPWCREMHIDRGAEDFCSMAERREDE